MPTQGQPCHEILITTVSATTAKERLVTAVTNTKDYSISVVTPEVVTARRQYTPRWAIVTAVATCLVLPVLLLLLVIKRAEAVAFGIKSDGEHTIVTVHGVATDLLLTRVKEALPPLPGSSEPVIDIYGC